MGGASGLSFSKKCGFGDSLLRKYLEGSIPGADKLVAIARAAGVRVEWLATGEGPMRRIKAQALIAGPTVPVIGLAECGLRGWFQERPLGLLAPAPTGITDPDALAVIAVGDSMRPAGISPGALVVCSPAAELKIGKPVLAEMTGGKASLKVWGGRKDDWVTLQGWLAPDEAGQQMPYTDRRHADQVDRICAVVDVRSTVALPAAAATAEINRDAMMTATRAVVIWQERDKVELTAAAFHEAIAACYRELLSEADQYGNGVKAEAELMRGLRLSLRLR